MRKSMFLALLLIGLLFAFSSCDINIFSSFEKLPVFSENDLEDALGDVPDDGEGNIDLTGFTVVSGDGGAGPVVVDEGLTDYLDLIDEMADNDTLDDFEAGGGDLDQVAENLDKIVDGVLEALDIDLDDEDQVAALATKTFKEIVDDAMEADVPAEEVQALREVLQDAATASVAVRMAADDNAGVLVEDTSDILLSMLGEMGTFRSRSLAERTIIFNDSDSTDTVTLSNLASKIQLVFQGHTALGADQYYVMYTRDIASDTAEQNVKFYPYTDTASLPGIELDGTGNDENRSSIIDLVELQNPANVFTDDLDQYMIPATDTLPGVTLEELLVFIDRYLGYGTDSISNAGELVDQVYATFGAYIPNPFEDVEAAGGSESNPVQDIIDTMAEKLNFETFDVTVDTFDSMADAGRAFLSTLSIEPVDPLDPDGEQELVGLGSKYLTPQGALNADGLKMTVMSMIGFVIDYAAKVDPDDPIGMITIDPFTDFINATDAITIEAVDEGTADEFMRITLKYVADAIPYSYADEDVDGVAGNEFPDGLQYDLITRGGYYDEYDMWNAMAGYMNYAGFVKIPWAFGEVPTPTNKLMADYAAMEKVPYLFDLVDLSSDIYAELELVLGDPETYNPANWMPTSGEEGGE